MVDNNYCACSSGDGKYTIKLNQQGAVGRRGEQGEKGLAGYSPTVTVVQDDDTSYILRISNEFSSYNTPNLFPVDKVNTWGEQLSEQITTEIGQLGENFVTTNTQQEIIAIKTFTNAETRFEPNKDDVFYNTFGKIRIKQGYQLVQIRFNSKEIEDDKGYFNGAALGFNCVDNKLMYYKGSSREINLSDRLELATIGDLPTVATTEKLGLVKPDGDTITIDENGVLKAIGGGSGGAAIDDENISKNKVYSSFKTNELYTENKTSIETVDDKVTTNTTNIETLQTKVDSLTTQVTSLEQQVGQQATLIQSLQEQDTTLLELINQLKDRITTLETTIDGGNA